jgi:YidC/Oxa1 family membrane protein insertase
MVFRSILGLTGIIFYLFCASLAGQPAVLAQDANVPDISVVGGSEKTVTLGSLDPNTGFKFLLELTSQGAAISKATLSEFDDRDYKNPQPLVLLSPATRPDGTTALSMANQTLVLTDVQLQLPLDKLYWNASDVTSDQGGFETAKFEATIKDKTTGNPLIKLTKTFRVWPGLYHVDCNITFENMSSGGQKMEFSLAGPVGINREDPRADTRKVVGGFKTSDGEIISSRTDLVVPFPMSVLTRNVGLKAATKAYELAAHSGNREQIARAGRDLQIDRNLPDSQRFAYFLWGAITNKYFTAITRPVPQPGTDYCDWIKDKTGWFYNPDGDNRSESGDETIGINFQAGPVELAPAGQQASTKSYSFQIYLGPKDRDILNSNKLYRDLGFFQTIDFMPCCCCPAAIIHPLAFGILWLMKWLHGFWPYNYGVVIIILVLLVRLILHPLTRKSQVSMSKYTKFNMLPEVQEIRKKYAKEPMEMHRRTAELQKKHGISHSAMLMGMLPTFVQMPIWIALYSAIYASIDLRGAGFLPFWITDLSAPDALFRFRAIPFPLFGKIDSFNLLPILMGVAFYLQQKLMPSQTASTDPQVAQQQKFMMIMMPVLFPLMLYTSPSGLNLYIMTSVFGGVIEQNVIKKHIREKEQVQEQGLVAVTSKTGGKVKKKKPKPFFKI